MASNNARFSMKILYGITKSNWGGAQKYVYDMALASQAAGHDVAVMCGGDGPLVSKLAEAGVRTINIPGFSRDIDMLDDAKRLWFIIKTVKAEKPDVFHINSSKMGGAGIFSGRLLGVPKIIFTAHGWPFREPRHWLQNLIIEELSWITVLASHLTICVSEKDYEDMARKPLTREKLVVIHNGIDVSHTNMRAGHKTGGDNVVVGTIAELHRNKGLDIGLRAFARAFKFTDAKLEIVGGGDERESLQRLSVELGIDSQVNLIGFRDNATALLSNFDIFILPSRKEGLPYTILEAGIAGLPVISTSVGGIPEIIKNGETGLLVPPEDPKALADALKKLSDNSSERERLGNNLHNFVKKNFSKEKMVEETLSLYGEIGS
ncbi:glycosyltransferase family 4 protein [Candidatus Parcubacteria bacterium]|nr:glycosyltransferase family 4 protein [Candidatus Parcubacteria bacterium]